MDTKKQDPLYTDEGVPFVTPNNVQQHIINLVLEETDPKVLMGIYFDITTNKKNIMIANQKAIIESEKKVQEEIKQDTENKDKEKDNDKEKTKRKIIPFPKTSKHYQIVLELVNRFLINMGKDMIQDLKEFKNIERQELLIPTNKEALLELGPKIFAKDMFDKWECGYTRQDAKSFELNVLRQLVIKLGLQFDYDRKAYYEKINGKSYRRTGYYYKIF